MSGFQAFEVWVVASFWIKPVKGTSCEEGTNDIGTNMGVVLTFTSMLEAKPVKPLQRPRRLLFMVCPCCVELLGY